VSGGSAGGHLAIALCVCPVNDEINAARPNSCVVFNPNVTIVATIVVTIVGLQRWAELTGFSPPDGN
jgi:acetyl esterase/lipase